MSFVNPTGISSDPSGNIYVYNNVSAGQILKINSSGTLVTTLANSIGVGLNGLVYLNGNVYIGSSQNTIISFNNTSPTQSGTIVAGQSGVPGSTDGALGVNTLLGVVALTTDGTDLYVVDGTLIRKVNIGTSPLGTVTTLVSSGTFATPTGISYAAGVGLFVGDQGGTTYKGVTTISIPGLTLTNFVNGEDVYDVHGNSEGTFYFTSQANVVRYYNGVDTILAGGFFAPGAYINAPIGINARFDFPTNMTLYNSTLFISDDYNNAIRTVSLTNPYAVTTFYGAQPPVNPCIPAGQLIRTLRSDVPVETVKSGDHILTPDGRSVVVKVHKSTILATKHDAPYLIPAHTFRPGYPKKDIQLSPNHKIQIGPDLWLSAEKASQMYPAIKQLVSDSLVHYFHFETPDFLTDDLVVEGSVVESYGVGYTQKYLKGRQPYVWSEKHKAEIRMVPGSWRA
jgi:hypothetical protein